jgi:hypothetical protein
MENIKKSQGATVMKRILIFILIIMTFSLSSCGENANMFTLTEYQNRGFSAKVKIYTPSHTYTADIEKRAEKIFIHFNQTEDLYNFTFAVSENSISVITEEMELPLEGRSLSLLLDIYSFFAIQVSDTWKIEKKRTSGVDIYVCQSEAMSLYIDANSRLPLKISNGELSADILCFKQYDI